MIDWNQLAMQPGIERLGAVLREEFGVWVGLLDGDGQSYPLAGRLVELEQPACGHFMAMSVLANQTAGEERTCRQSLRRWAGEGASGETRGDESDSPAIVETTCHAGFSAMLVSLDHLEGCQGTVYISGYVESERGFDALGALRGRLEEEGADDEASIEELTDNVPRLDRSQRQMMRAIARHLVDEIERFVSHEVDRQEPGDEPTRNFHGMVAGSRSMLDLFETVRTVADGGANVLIEGENGTGKELVARALHLESNRSDGPFVALNCAAIPGELIASELFGHKKGAFSGAHRDREGLLSEADGGTLLLDEIGDMDLHLQVKLLRFLQEGTYAPVGANTRRRVDVRVLCATNRDIQRLVEVGEFRRDLFFRINVIHLRVPPLRRRPTDIEILARHFLSRSARRHGGPIKKLSEACLERLRGHDWPGNVRELENEIERMVILSGDEPTIGLEHLSERIDGSAAPGLPVVEGMTLPEAIEQLERSMILEGLQKTGWNKSQTARDLDVSRRTLIRKVDRYELEQFRDE